MAYTYRDLVTTALLILVTFGIYTIYWLVVTKDELNRNGATIPTALLLIVPFANIYFTYVFAQAFAINVIKDRAQTTAYFLLLLLLLPIGILVCQSQMNEISTPPNRG